MKKKNQKLTLNKQTISILNTLNILGGAKSGAGGGSYCDSVYMSCAKTIYQNCPPLPQV